MEKIAAGRAYCALCSEVIRAGEDAFVTPDFLADEAHPFWRFADAPMHRTCFRFWERRKGFIACYNRLARQWSGRGPSLRMTSEGELVPIVK